jgi:hypothetical protein
MKLISDLIYSIGENVNTFGILAERASGKGSRLQVDVTGNGWQCR